MEKSKTAIAPKNKKNSTAGSNPTGHKKSGNAGNSSTTSGVTDKVKSKVGHGLANEGTTGTYEEGDR